MRVLSVFGGKDKSLTTRGIKAIEDILREEEIDVILHEDTKGIARNIDNLAFPSVQIGKFPINYQVGFDKRGAKKRNKVMLNLSHIAVIFPGGHNAESIKKEAGKRGLIIYDFIKEQKYIY